jgi:hypothetical protein
LTPEETEKDLIALKELFIEQYKAPHRLFIMKNK